MKALDQASSLTKKRFLPAPRVSARPSGVRNSRESGFAFLMAMLLVAIVVITSTVVMESVAARVRREREQEMIWRGNQYARAIRLYYHKVGRYPQSVDDLMEGVPDDHFLRQVYKNPMNTDDGTWRFIYVNQAGQIIGSTRYASLQQMAIMDTLGIQPGAIPQALPGQPGVPAGALASSEGGGSGSTASALGALLPALPYSVISSDNPAAAEQAYYESSGQPPPSNPPPSETTDQSQSAFQNPTQGMNSGQSAFSSGFGQPGASPFQSQSPGANSLGQPGVLGSASSQTASALAALNSGILQQKPTGAVDGPVLGAFLTGVGGKADRKSIIWLHGAKKYKDWEFIWNPVEDQAAAMQQQLNQATGTGIQGGLPVANPFGGSTGANPQTQSNPAPPQTQPQQ
ncbi:MAG TPA: hypothetical protein VMJ93_01295 [Verrucomicrobiae bacterium]|nr:hypothetical protein [Verrucomicrobiae bacterium]